MTILALDAGNSALKGALIHADETVHAAFRLPTPFDLGALSAALRTLPGRPDAAGFASVVPALTEAILGAVTRAFGLDVQTVHAGRRLPFATDYTTTETLGADRIAAIAGAFRAGEAVVVVSAGTALTVEAVTAAGVHLGGAIAPGPGLLAASLAAGTAALPRIEPVPDAQAVGRSTREALEAGVAGMYAGGAAHLVRSAMAASGATRVVVTGGWAGMLTGAFPVPFEPRPHLVLEGVARIVRLNAI